MAELDEELEWHRVEEAGMMGLNFVQDGKMDKVLVQGHAICIARKGNELFAVRNRCPHAGGALHQGWINETGHLVCPLHRFRFCLEKDEAGPEGFKLQHFPVRVHKDELQIGLPKRKKWLGIF